MRLSIAPNPSHLEFIGPVVLGMVRAEQTRLQDTAKERVMGLLIHGDAAFAGLGVVAETLQLADTPGASHQQQESNAGYHDIVWQAFCALCTVLQQKSCDMFCHDAAS